jgi:hypothetical protein
MVDFDGKRYIFFVFYMLKTHVGLFLIPKTPENGSKWLKTDTFLKKLFFFDFFSQVPRARDYPVQGKFNLYLIFVYFFLFFDLWQWQLLFFSSLLTRFHDFY